ncbi:MAG: methylmalonyl Co-A mutase-associated GTPase MeaB [Salinirussus sp.]
MNPVELAEAVVGGDHRALARAITLVENREDGYRDLVSRLHAHAGDAAVVGITGSPGSGKSTLVDKMAATYRDRGLTVGVIAIDPSSPYTGGAVLGDRIRMGSTVGDMDTFIRSMSARGSLGGLSAATADAVTALSAFGKDRIVIETVGAGQNEIDIVRAADSVAVLVPPGTGDDVQMLKAGILEIADLFVVNKADLDGVDRTVRELRETIEYREGDVPGSVGRGADGADADGWSPRIVETVANRGEGIEAVLSALADHRTYLRESGEAETRRRRRYAEQIRTLLREDVNSMLATEVDARGGLDRIVDRVMAGETDPYAAVDELLAPVAASLSEDADGG